LGLESDRYSLNFTEQMKQFIDLLKNGLMVLSNSVKIIICITVDVWITIFVVYTRNDSSITPWLVHVFPGPSVIAIDS